jgi:isoleucyl-tRNA synthetase
VLELDEDLGFPCDVYLEGSDQHRGWFQSSLLCGVAARGVAPYGTCVTHGFVVDEQGRKMSKSLGNGIEPQDITRTLGADMLRLWVAATDFANEMSLSQEILKRMADSYRRMRNTVRFLLGNLHGFDPAQALPVSELVALDAYALERANALQTEVDAAYRDYQFHLIYQKVHNFCVVDLGGFYLDIIKDRLYTTPAASRARRSAQTAMWHIAEAMVRWLAPILSFTAEEIWRELPGPRAASVFLATWHELPAAAGASGAIDWQRFIALRTDVARELERLRIAGEIGAPLQAELEVYCNAEQYPRLTALGDELRFLMITSKARVHRAESAPADAVAAASVPGGGVWLQVRPTTAAKCVRCWHHTVDVGSVAAHPELCGRCVGNLAEPGEARRFA